MDSKGDASDAIELRGLIFYGYHGALAEERTVGQRFSVDLRLELDLHRAGQSDDLAQTVNYADVWLAVREIVEGPPVTLIEAVAERVAGTVLERFARIDAVRVDVHKPSAPIAGAATGDVVVRLTRRRSRPSQGRAGG